MHGSVEMMGGGRHGLATFRLARPAEGHGIAAIALLAELQERLETFLEGAVTVLDHSTDEGGGVVGKQHHRWVEGRTPFFAAMREDPASGQGSRIKGDVRVGRDD